MNFLKRIHFRPHLSRSLKSTRQDLDLSKGKNEVRIIGTVERVPPNLFHDSLVFFVKTFDDTGFFDRHKVIIPSFTINKCPKIVEGQNVFVMGKVRSSKFIKNDGTQGTQLETKARKVYLCKNDEISMSALQSDTDMHEASDSLDVPISNLNYVEINAQISFEIQNKEKFSVFTLASQYLKENSEDIRETHVDFISIFVYDNDLRQYIRNHLKSLDVVRVEGTLKSKSKLSNEGKYQQEGYIVANKINKVVTVHKLAENKVGTSKKKTESNYPKSAT